MLQLPHQYKLLKTDENEVYVLMLFKEWISFFWYLSKCKLHWVVQSEWTPKGFMYNQEK